MKKREKFPEKMKTRKFHSKKARNFHGQKKGEFHFEKKNTRKLKACFRKRENFVFENKNGKI